MTFHTYEPAKSCTGHAQPGTINLAAACNDWTGANTGYPYGIYNCRLPSIHSEGRALDIGFPGVGSPLGTGLARVLVLNAWELGLMGVIWNRTRWSARTPSGAPYTGASPHTDHIHVEQTWEAARDNPLTVDTARRLILGDDDMSALTDALRKVPTEVYRKASQVPGSTIKPFGTQYWGAQGAAGATEYDAAAPDLLAGLLMLLILGDDDMPLSDEDVERVAQAAAEKVWASMLGPSVGRISLATAISRIYTKVFQQPNGAAGPTADAILDKLAERLTE